MTKTASAAPEEQKFQVRQDGSRFEITCEYKWYVRVRRALDSFFRDSQKQEVDDQKQEEDDQE